MSLSSVSRHPGSCGNDPSDYCPKCNGTGRVVYKKYQRGRTRYIEYIDCKVCKGSGSITEAIKQLFRK